MKKYLITLLALMTFFGAQAQESEIIYTDFKPESYLPFWTDTITSQPDGYVVDAEGNVKISNSDGLVWLISTVNGLNGCDPDDFDGRTVSLSADIDFGETGMSYRFTPIGTRETPFLGTFDGNGHSINNLFLRYSAYEGIDYYFDIGIFGYIRHATVKNTTIDSTCRISSSCEYPGYYRGGMVGFSDSLSLVENCHVRSRLLSFWNGGSLVGINRNSTVRNCSFNAFHYGTNYGGGLVSLNRSEGGYSSAVVENCYYYGRIDGSISSSYIGGLVGFNETMPNDNSKQAVIRNCHSTPTSDFYASNSYGTLVAVHSNESLLENCYSDLTEMYQYGQMVGVNDGEMRDCLPYANIGGIGTLSNPITINGTTTDILLDALNLWIVEQDHPELYRTWGMATDSVPVFGDYHTGIKEIEAMSDEVKAYPNPATSFATITGKNLKSAEVFNTLGQRVAMVQGQGETLQIDIAKLPAGVYFVNVMDEEGRKCIRKVVKE